ncbi:hypothetical protein B0H14DRAFT_3468213 [Mycena olivaceomarginata]|nr:hypothetical protein B0H14DRAFT_3468213 [Mycena olivaceomarginata]
MLCAGPVDKIVLGPRYRIAEWLRPAYLALVMRKQSITVEEGVKLRVKVLVQLRALEDKVYSKDPTGYIDEKLFCEVLKSMLPAQQQPFNTAAQQPLAVNIGVSAPATVFMVSAGQPPAPALLTPICFSGTTPEFIPFLNYSPHCFIHQDAVPAFAERICTCADVAVTRHAPPVPR